MGDHPPITPVRSADRGALGPLDWKIYNFIARNFFATISAKAKFKVLNVLFTLGDEEFTLQGR